MSSTCDLGLPPTIVIKIARYRGVDKLDILHLAVLAVVQGVTEFLPISSSGHLVLVPLFMDMPDQGQLMDVAVHVGTLGAVLLYLWRDVFNMCMGLGHMMRGRSDPGARLAGLLVIGTIPVIAAGGVGSAGSADRKPIAVLIRFCRNSRSMVSSGVKDHMRTVICDAGE